jgi:putative ABC transport system substrate-binding protein
MRAGAEPFGISIQSFVVAEPWELEPAFEAMMQWGAEAVVMSGAPNLLSDRQRIARLALRSKVASFGPFSDYAEAGALMSYGVDRLFQARKIATYVVAIFRGANAGDLPIEQPTRFDLVLNRKTAKALGLDIPQRLLLQADKVID